MNRIAFHTLPLAAAVLVSMTACSPPPPSSSDPGTGTPPPPPPVAETVIGLGDVETSMTFKAVLDPASNADNVRSHELMSMRKDLAMVEVTVSRPFSEHLWLHLSIAKNTVGFRGNPVVVRGGVFIDEVKVKAFGYGFTNPPEPGHWEERLDVLAGLEDIPKTMLVHAEAELILLNKGDPIPEDVQAVESGPDNTATIYSNPVRIDFKF